jgi:hypothetical protein
MNLIKKLFQKPFSGVNDEETTWTRDKISPDQIYYPPSIDDLGQVPKNNEFSLVTSNQKNNPMEEYYFPDTKAASTINQPAWMNQNSQPQPQSEPKSKYVDYGIPQSQNNSFRANNRKMVTQNNEYGLYLPTLPTKNPDQAQENLLNAPNFSQLNDSYKFPTNEKRRINMRPDQEFGRNHRVSSLVRNSKLENPRLKDYYDLENRINRQMMLSSQEVNQKSRSKQIDIFNNEDYYNPQVYNSASVNKNFQSKAYSQPRTDIFADVKAESNLAKQRLKIFEGQTKAFANVNANPSKTQNSTKNNSNVKTHFTPNWMMKSDIMNNNPYEGKDFEELSKIYAQKSSELHTLEDQLIVSNHDPRNITSLEHTSNELSSKIENIKQKSHYTEGERRVLQEDMNKKQIAISNIDKKPDFISSMPSSEMNAKENIIKEIEKVQAKVLQTKKEFDNFYITIHDKQQKWKDLSEKNMKYELETMQMNLNNYDEELIQELRYFLDKYK